MRKLIALILGGLFLFTVAVAESDLQAMTVDELTQLRQSVDMELALRAQEDETAQIVIVGDLVFKLHQALVGTGKDKMPAIAIVFAVSNASDSTKSLMEDVNYNIIQGGNPLGTTFINAVGYGGPSVIDSMSAKIKPGAVDMLLCVAGLLTGEGDTIEVDLYNRKAPRNEDPYCGSFTINLADIS